MPWRRTCRRCAACWASEAGKNKTRYLLSSGLALLLAEKETLSSLFMIDRSCSQTLATFGRAAISCAAMFTEVRACSPFGCESNLAMPRPTNRLSASLVATAQPHSHGRRSRLIHDGNGLYLQVTHAGTRSFAFRYTINGRTRLMGLGSVTITSLSAARKRALELKVLVAGGTDPLGQRAAAAVASPQAKIHRMTFQRAAKIYIETHAPSWSN